MPAPDATTSLTVPTLWLRWLQAAVGATILFGLAMALLPEITRQGFGLILYGEAGAVAGFGPEVQPYLRLSHAVMGSLMVGWGLALWLVVQGPFRRGDRLGWNVLAISQVGWYVPDTAVSIATGLWPNAVLNTVFALAYAVPLLATRSLFRAR